jgi:predicted nucleic acid-binding Zn ribbon protein
MRPVPQVGPLGRRPQAWEAGGQEEAVPAAPSSPGEPRGLVSRVSPPVRHVSGPPETARALLAGPPCPVCGRPLRGRQRTACSARCRAEASRQRKRKALDLRILSLQARALEARLRFTELQVQALKCPAR